MYRHLSIILVAILCACTPMVVQQTSTPPEQKTPPTPPPPTVVATEIDVDSVIITENPLSVRLATPIFAPGAVLPKAAALAPLANWFDFIRRKPTSHWQVQVSVATSESSNAGALAAARADILLRLIKRTGLDPERFEFVTSATTQSSIEFHLK